jgi:hypothetical protein
MRHNPSFLSKIKLRQSRPNRKLGKVCFLLFAIGIALVMAPRDRAASQSRIPQPIDSSRRAALGGSVHPLARPEFDLGRMAGDERIADVMLMFGPTPQQQAELDAFLAAQQDRSSPLYHRFVSPEEFGTRFGLNESDLAKVTSWLEAQGFNVTGVARSRNFVTFGGTARQLEAALGTEMHRYAVGGQTHFANSTEPRLPLALAGVVTAIRGLHDFHPQARAAQAHFTSYLSGKHFQVPYDWATIYDVVPLYNLGFHGEGQNIAVIGQANLGANNNSLEDPNIHAFRAAAGLPAATIEVHNFGPAPSDAGDLGEAYLDLEWANGIAPNAHVIFVTSDDAFKSLTQAIANNYAPVISVSYGACEGAGTWVTSQFQASKNEALALQTSIQQGNAQGVTVVAAAGDSGAADCDDGTATQGLAVDVPASIPEVTAIGGTQLGNSSADWTAANNSVNQGSATGYVSLETVWNETAMFNNAPTAGGGGASLFFKSKPAWQSGLTPPDNARDVPDIALSAGAIQDPLLECAGSGDCVNGFRNATNNLDAIGGTSAGAPPFAGVLALLNQMNGVALVAGAWQNAQGNINPALYSLAAASTDFAFHRISIGDNFVPCTPGTPTVGSPPASIQCPQAGKFGFLSTTNKYDQSRGLGSIDAYKLLYELKNSATSAPGAPDFTTQPANPNGLALVPGQTKTATVTFGAVNGFTGQITVSCFVGGGQNNTVPELQVTGVSCSADKAKVNPGDTVTLTLTATPDAAALHPPLRTPWMLAQAGVPALLFGLALIGGRKRGWRGMLAMAVIAAAAACVTSCGGGGGSSTSQTTTNTVTTPALATLTVNPTSVFGGLAATGTVTLSTAAPAGGATVTLASDNPLATVPASMVVPAGATSANFTIATSSNVNAQTATITGTYNASRGALLSLKGPVQATVAVQGVAGSSVHVSVIQVTVD